MYYKEAVDLWNKSFCEKSKEYGSNKKKIIVSIARKGPRLCELSDIEEDVISEHAIPFSLSNFLNSLVVVTDEAIYFGTTFQRIYTVLKTGINLYQKKRLKEEGVHVTDECPIVKADPVVISKKAKQLLENKIDWLISDLNTISDECIPKYINDLIENFYGLGKPFDIEFPIFYINFPEELYEMDNPCIAKFLKGKFEHIKPERGKGYTYILKHRAEKMNYYTVTRLFSDEIYQNNRKLHSDFSKMRAFWHKDKRRIALTFYSPHIIDDKYLVKDSPLFAGTPYAEIWSKLWAKASIVEDIYEWFENESADLDFEKRKAIEYDLQEYKYHVKRSLLVWANYLYSYDMAMELIPSLKKELFGDKAEAAAISIEERDICYLSGIELVKDIVSSLNNILYSYNTIQMPIVPMDDVLVNNYIPEAYLPKYEIANANALSKCRDMSELVSMIFYNMHFNVEIEGRNNWKEDLSRLRFGETFSSIYNRGFVGNYSEVFHSMHKSLDFRIDNGSIVPKYVCRNNGGSKFWFRMFRCGENEDLFAQRLIRFIEKLLRIISETYDNSLLPEVLIRSAFTVYLTPPIDAEGVFEGVNLSWKFVTRWGDWGPQVCFINELSDNDDDDKKDNQRDLFEFCKWHGLIEDSDVNGFCRINSFLPPAIVPKWNQTVIEKLGVVADSLVNMMNNGVSVLDAAEWLLYKNEVMNESHKKLIKWCTKYKELPQELSSDGEFVQSFNELNLTFPRSEKDIISYLQELAEKLDGKNINNQKLNLAVAWLNNLKTFAESEDFKRKRELSFMMYRLIMCCLFLSKESYADTLEIYANTLDEFSLCADLSFTEIVKNKDEKKMRNAYKHIVAQILNVDAR